MTGRQSADPDLFQQDGYRCRLAWGWQGAADAAARGNITVIVDVLRFSSVVAVAARQDAAVYPCEMEADVAARSAHLGAIPGGRSRGGARYSLSPSTFDAAPAGAKVVLPSLNGAMCSIRARPAPYVFATSLLNATSVAAVISRLLEVTALDVTVVACGERWSDGTEDGALRFAVEDFLGAGAVLSRLSTGRSPEAAVCAAAFEASRDDIARLLFDCASGRELRAMGLEQDVRDCSHLDAIDAVPVLRGDRYERWRDGAPG